MIYFKLYIYWIAFLCFCKDFVRSDYETECGRKWQRDYTKFHNDALSSLLTSKKHQYVISIAPPQGLSDRLSGFVTHFMFSLITKRVYLHVTPPNLPLVEVAYDVGYGGINTNLFNHSSIVSFDLELFNLPLSGYKQSEGKHNDTHGVYLNAGGEMNSKQRIRIRKRNKRLFTGSNFSSLKYMTKDRIVFLGNRGFSYQMFENPYHNATLYGMGLTPDNAFKCVFNYLFKLKEPSITCDSSGKLSACLDKNGSRKSLQLLNRVTELQSQGNIVIGVHVRLGDHIFDKNMELTVLIHVDWYLKCALELREEFHYQQNMTGAGKQAYILFLSDSLDLKVEVLKKYGESIILVSIVCVICMVLSGAVFLKIYFCEKTVMFVD